MYDVPQTEKLQLQLQVGRCWVGLFDAFQNLFFSLQYSFCPITGTIVSLRLKGAMISEMLYHRCNCLRTRNHMIWKALDPQCNKLLWIIPLFLLHTFRNHYTSEDTTTDNISSLISLCVLQIAGLSRIVLSVHVSFELELAWKSSKFIGSWYKVIVVPSIFLVRLYCLKCKVKKYVRDINIVANIFSCSSYETARNIFCCNFLLY